VAGDARCFWLTGLPGAGKTTLARLLEVRLRAQGRTVMVLDGDLLRQGLNRDLGFSDADRAENIRRTAEVARLLVDAGTTVVVALISPLRAERDKARERFAPGTFVEVFVDAPLAECERRDPKGLYARARRGELRQFTGIDSAYEPPLSPDLHLHTADSDARACAGMVLHWLASPPPAPPSRTALQAAQLHAAGLQAWDAGDAGGAVDAIVQAIAIDGRTGIYHRNLGEMLRRLGHTADAIVAGEMATALEPRDPAGHDNLALALADAQDWAGAARAGRRALALDGNNGHAWNNLGAVLERLGDVPGAQAAYEHAVAIDATHAEARNNLGVLLLDRGDVDGARACFQAAVDARPGLTDAHFNLSALKTYAEGDADLAALESAETTVPAMDVPRQVRFWFAVGKAREDTGRYGEAFAAYRNGNRLEYARRPWDDAAADAQLAGMVRLFDRAFVTGQGGTGDGNGEGEGEGAVPVFIVGMPRSGTTLLEQVVDSHPRVFGAGERNDLADVLEADPALAGRALGPALAALDAAGYARLGAAYLARMKALVPASASDTTHIVNKLPGNFAYLGLVLRMLPGARIIHAMRDPMDSCFSCWSRLFHDTLEYTYDLGALARHYKRYAAYMRHWHTALPAGTILDLRYEDMVAHTRREAQRAVAHLGLPWDERCLAFHQNRRAVHTASVAQVRKPIYTSSVARWERFRDHLGPLLAELRDERERGGFA